MRVAFDGDVFMPTVKKWKRFESRVAKALGGERVPVTGKGRADRDVEAGMFYYQTKYRDKIPSWLFEWLDGIVLTAKRAEKVGALVLNQPGRDTADALVVVRFSDWVDLHGCVSSTNDEHASSSATDD